MNYFRSNLFQELIFDNAQGSAIPNIKGVKELRELPIPLPPLAEQQEIVRRVEAFFNIADSVEEYYHKAQQQLDKLPQAILAKAFSGELVAQDPNDEPACMLLKRITDDRLPVVGRLQQRRGGGAKRRLTRARAHPELS